MRQKMMQQKNCWNQVGVLGDRSCTDLSTVVHCHNCLVYRQVGRGLLERPIPDEYATEWTRLLAQDRNQQQVPAQDNWSINIFRLGQEWLALSTTVIQQILPPRPVHSIPHRSNQLLKGIVNVQGQLLLCISLHELLGIKSTKSFPPYGNASIQSAVTSNVNTDSSLLVIERNQDVWAFEVDKMYGLHRCSVTDFRNAPALGGQTLKRFTQSIVSWQDQTVSYLDEVRVFEALQQEAL